jgi:hypothetical protein
MFPKIVGATVLILTALTAAKEIQGISCFIGNVNTNDR